MFLLNKSSSDSTLRIINQRLKKASGRKFLMPFPILLKSHVNSCSITEWYPNNSKFSIPTLFVPLDDVFVKYLLTDGVVVPDMPNNTETLSDTDLSDEDDEQEQTVPEFPEIAHLIQKSIDIYGSVFPKLNWSAPKDAAWIAFGNTLRCERVSDVLLLLKVSEFVTHDLVRAFDHCEESVDEEVQKVLALRKYQSINQSCEFRCFVVNRSLVAISQRNLTFFPELINSYPTIVDRIVEFFPKIVIDLDDYIFDVVVQKRVTLIDISPCCPTTDPILFDWNDLLEFQHLAPPRPIIKFVQSEQESSKEIPYAVNRYPKETFDFSNGRTLAEFAESISTEFAQSSK